MLNNKTKDNEKNINTNKKSPRAYMSSYEWNYLVLDIVDYLEQRLVQIESGDSPDSDLWKNFKNYCSEHNLNWRVTIKMIEFSINTPFESERELANHESFRALFPGRDKLSQKWSSRSEPLQEVKLLREKSME